jgi:hypothetical protein
LALNVKIKAITLEEHYAFIVGGVDQFILE